MLRFHDRTKRACYEWGMTISAAPAGLPAPGVALAAELFQLLRDGHPRTRAELSAATGLARSTVASRLEVLAGSGLITPAGEATSSGGRPPSCFAFNPDDRVLAAVDVGATHVRVALTDLAGRILERDSTPMAVTAGPESVLGWACTAIRSLLATGKRRESEVGGIGIGLPGPVEHSSGRPVNPPIMPGWDGFDVVGFVQESYPVDVLVDNDVNIMALGEQSAYWPQTQDLLFLKVATGIGAGMISSGRLQRGANGTAGDVGHVRVPGGDGVSCRCGNTGCLEAVASGPALAAALSARGLPAQEGRDVVDYARQGNVEAIRALRQAGRDVGEVLATCVNLLNPAVIVVGGGMASAGEQLLAGVREVVYSRSLPLATSGLQIVASAAGEDAALLGAGRLVSDQLLSPEGVARRLGAGT